jgi:hypothetical protein
MKSEIIFNETENRYEMAVGDHTVYANVRKDKARFISITFLRRRSCAVKARPGNSWKD